MNDVELRRLQMMELQILKDFAEFCDENGIVYYLDAGTLLGAVRHQGFIPWDDDVDVCMDVKNYRKLMKLAHKLPEQYFFQNFRTEFNLGTRWSRIRMNGTTHMSANETAYDIHAGFGIDVFVVAGVAKTWLGRKIQNAAGAMFGALLCKHLMEALGKPISVGVKLIHAVLPEKLRIRAAELMERMWLLDTGHGDRVFNMWSRKLEMDTALYVGEPVRLPFEGNFFSCPPQYEKVLEAHYGDWKVLPPEEERVNHGEYIVDYNNPYTKYLINK